MANVVFFSVVFVVIIVSIGVWILFKNVVLDYDYPTESIRTKEKSKHLEKDSSSNSSDSQPGGK